MKMLWLDLETTGLDPIEDKILAIGMKFTDFNLNQLSPDFEQVIRTSADDLKRMDDFVRNMHTKSGLLQKINEVGQSMAAVEDAAFKFIAQYGANKDDTYLAGNSVYFDRSFLFVHAGSLLNNVNYRIVDISSLKVLAKAWIPQLAEQRIKREPAHTPIADINESIEEFRYWNSVLFKAGLNLLNIKSQPKQPHSCHDIYCHHDGDHHLCHDNYCDR